MQKKTIIQFAVGLLLGLTLTALVAFNVLLVWVATGPRSLEKLTPYIETALTGESDVHAKIGETWLLWDGWQHPLDIRLKDVSLLTKEGVVFSTFPQISLGLDVLALPFGQILPTSLSVTKPIISIHQNPDKSLGFSALPKEEDVSNGLDTLTALISSLINPHSESSLRKLRTIELLNADVSIGNDKDGVVVSAPDTTFIVRKQSRKQVVAILRGTVKYANNQSQISGQFSYNKSARRLEGVIDADNLQLATLSQIFTDNHELAALQLPLAGKIGFAFDQSGKLDALKFMVEGGKGKIVHERIDGALPVSHLKISGSADKGLTHATLSSAEIDFAGSMFNAKGSITKDEKGLAINGEASITDVDTDHARMFWPLGLSPLSREWVTSNIRDGGITKASAVVNIRPGDLDLPALPKEDVQAQLELKDARIRYLPDHPEVHGVDATLKVDGISLDADIKSAQAFTDTHLSNGRLQIADLNQDNPLIALSMHADAPASDIVTLLGLPKLEHAKHLNLVASKVSGRATGGATLGFYFFSKDASGAETPLTYDIKAHLDKMTTPAFLQRFDIENATGDLAVNEKSIEYDGSATVNGAVVSSGKVTYLFAPEAGIDTIIQAATGLNDDTLKRFGIRLPLTLKNTVNVTVDASLSTAKGGTSIPKFSLTGEGVNIAGNASLTEDGKDISKLKLDKVQFQKTHLNTLEYESIEGGYRLNMEGDALDLNPMFDKKDSNFSFTHFPAIDLGLDIGTLYGAYGQSVQGVKGRLLCSVDKCDSANISAMSDHKKLSFSIAPDGRNRRLTATSENAGAALRLLNITDSMDDGSLALNGQFDDMAGKGTLKGILNISDYTLKHAPILARMLSLASLTGFFDTLSGNGIAFKKMEAPFILQNDVITLKDAKTFGSAMGLTADGSITFPATNLKIEGTIVPSYTLNNVIGTVPLLGNLLMGGEGQGVFAARYDIKGNSDNPDVTVNPLSILTPGFLRHLFDAF